MESIAYCKIFPPIGIARLGDSEDGFFIGPEFPDKLPHKEEDFTFRDPSGKIKRQVARFRIYAFDKDGEVLGELTSKEAKITWKTKLANKKAAWFQYSGTKEAMDAFQGTLDLDESRIRNNTSGQLEEHPEAPIGAKYKPTPERASKLEITTDEIEISGTSLKTEINNQEHHYEFIGKFKGTHPVYLGELRTDDSGRLLVFGGHGVSDAIDENGNSIKGSRWIQNYANNDDWFDDTSDGYVKAEVVLEGKPVEVRGAAWVIVAPPDFAPDTKNLVTLFDVMEEVVYDDKKRLLIQDLFAPRGTDEVIYDEDIQPIFERMFGYRWVNDIALRGHGFQKPGDFQSDLKGEKGKLGKLEDPNSKEGEKLRKHIFEMIRMPIYKRPSDLISSNDKKDEDVQKKLKKQANAFYMPPFSGDEGDQRAEFPTRWLTVTHLQYARLQAWSESHFIPTKANDCKGKREDQPFMLTQTALEQCVGGAFFPGIEMTAIARHPWLYKEAYRLNDEVLKPGDVTKYMALPWQADFYECRDHWWPAQRPDDVIVDEDFDEIFSSFEEETVGDYKQQFELVLFNRKRWDRGLGSSRPSGEFLQNQLLTEPQKNQDKEDETVDSYIKSRTEFIADSLFSLTVARRYTSSSLKERVKYIDRLPSPWRLQFLTQEIFDQYAGRYFHLVVPSPEKVFSAAQLPKPISELRSSWASFLATTDRDDAIEIVRTYALAIQTSITEGIKAVFEDSQKLVVEAFPPDPDENLSPRKAYQQAVGKHLGAVNLIQSEHPEDFLMDSAPLKRLRLAEMLTIMIDILYADHSGQSGDMDMVDKWNSLGFVVEKKKTIKDREGNDNEITVVVETERSRYDGLSFRDYFYYLMNIEKYPDFVPYAKELAQTFLEQADGFIEQLGLQETDGHPESFVEYNEANFTAKLQQIYEILRAQANNTKPWMTSRNREDSIRRLIDNAPFNQTDGSWLRNIAKTGLLDEMQGLLFDIWSDEIGNGNPSLHHGNLYTALLQQLGYWLPEVSSRAYADHPNIPESSFIGAVLPLVISQHSNEFLPEILGMTLFLEWEVLSLVPGVKRLDYLGIDSHFFQMHVAIDNATEGHGHQAKRAVELYLDRIVKESGPEAMQQSWRRIWTGFVAFALGGSGIYSNGEQSDDAIESAYPGTPADRIAKIMRRKRPYGNLNHLNKKIGGFRINDMFDDPELFLEELAHSPWIEPGDPDRSGLLNHLTSFNGPMYKIFDKEDLDAWRDWVIWLGKEGDTAAPKRYIGKGEAMLMLLTELRSQAIAAHGHARYKLKSPEADDKNKQEPLPVSEWFSEPNLKKLMKALKDPANGWAIPGSPEDSPLVIDLASGVRPMGKILDQRFPTINNRIGRLIIVEWILAGCPIPGEKTPELSECGSIKGPEVRQLLVQEYGMGAVH